MIKDDNNLKLLIINNNELKIVVKNLENKLKENYRILKYVSEEVEILNNKKNKKLANYNGNYFKPNNYDIYQEEIV